MIDLWEGVDALFDVDNAGGPQLGFHLFDPQLCTCLTEEWLLGIAESSGFDPVGVRKDIASELISTWSDKEGNCGFLLCSPEQLTLLQELRSKGYCTEELRNIMSAWRNDIEGTLEVLPYDDSSVNDFEHFRRRVAEIVQDMGEQAERLSTDGEVRQAEQTRHNLSYWKRIYSFAERSPNLITDSFRLSAHKTLFRMRWLDEWIRISNAERFRAQILQGYSPEVFFLSYEQRDLRNLTFGKIDWKITLGSIKRSRATGTRLPLRTPEFTLDENGVHLPNTLNPQQYSELYSRYEIDSLSMLLVEDDIWNPQRQTGLSTCAECGRTFSSPTTNRRYCSESCRNRAKCRRWRNKDPERARMSQAKYWQSYYGVDDGDTPTDESPLII